MNNYLKFFIIGLIIIIGDIFAIDHCRDRIDIQNNENFRTIDSDNDYYLRIYLFSSLDYCHACNIWLKNFINIVTDKDSIELVLFIDKATSSEIATLKKTLAIDCKIIPDEFSIYKEFFKIKKPLTGIILDNNGKLLHCSKIASKEFSIQTIDKLYNKVRNTFTKKQPSNKNLKEIGYLDFKNKDGKSIKTSILQNLMVYSKKNKKYYLIHNRKCYISIFNQFGVLDTTIGFEKISKNNCYMPFSMNWFIEDSLLFIYYNLYTSVPYISLFDINKLKFIKHIKLNYIDINKNIDYSLSLSSFNKLFFMHFSQGYNEKKEKHFKLAPDIPIFYIYDISGKKLEYFDTPDKPYITHTLSRWFGAYISYSKKAHKYYSLQSNSNCLKIWNDNFNLIKTKILELDSFRTVNFDINDNIDINDIWNNFSQFQDILVDNVTGNFIISYVNYTYPKNEYDVNSSKVQKVTFFNFYDSDGNKLNKEPIFFNNVVIPFYYSNNEIYVTDIKNFKLSIKKFKFQID